MAAQHKARAVSARSLAPVARFRIRRSFARISFTVAPPDARQSGLAVSRRHGSSGLRRNQFRVPTDSRRVARFALSPGCGIFREARSAEGSHNGSAAVLKTAGRKAMQVRVLSPPPFIPWYCNQVHQITLLRRTPSRRPQCASPTRRSRS
jgi:hypothetical protein